MIDRAVVLSVRARTEDRVPVRKCVQIRTATINAITSHGPCDAELPYSSPRSSISRGSSFFENHATGCCKRRCTRTAPIPHGHASVTIIQDSIRASSARHLRLKGPEGSLENSATMKTSAKLQREVCTKWSFFRGSRLRCRLCSSTPVATSASTERSTANKTEAAHRMRVRTVDAHDRRPQKDWRERLATIAFPSISTAS